MVLAYAIMSNHFHIFIYVPEPEDIGDEEILRRINALYREASLAQLLGEWTRLKDEEAKLLEARTDPDHPQSPQQRYCLT